jgi:hypothetical protein
LPKKVNPLGCYTTKEEDNIRAYSLLTHAELEYYFEAISVKKVDDALKKWQANKKYNSPILLSLCCFIEHTDRVKNENTLEGKIRQIVGRYRETISKNNGIVSNIIKGIDNGIPLLLSIDYKEDGNHGHVTVAVGYTEKGIIVNDPYGNLNSGTTYSAHDIDKGDGAFEEYDKTRWFIGEKWAGYLNK